MRWVNLLIVLLLNAVPAWGVFALGWSVGALLLLLWWENLLGTLAMAVKLNWHQRLTSDPRYAEQAREARSRGRDWRGPGTEYLSGALTFAVVNGIFAVGLLLAIMHEQPGESARWWPSLDDVCLGGGGVALLIVFDLVRERVIVARRSFESIQHAAGLRFLQLFFLLLTIIVGGLVSSDRWMLAVLLTFKTLLDVIVIFASERRDPPKAGRAASPSPQR